MHRVNSKFCDNNASLLEIKMYSHLMQQLLIKMNLKVIVTTNKNER